MKAAIVGVGVVGQAMRKLIPDAVGYDIKDERTTREDVNACDLGFVCVPTPMAEDGSCDTRIVEEVVAWLETPLIVIRSTVAPGTTDRLKQACRKRIVFQPEYLGETAAHPMSQLGRREFIVLGGDQRDNSEVADFYKQFYHSELRFYFCDAKTAELAKYMENSFYAVKVTFVNEFFDLARAFGVDFNELREIWLADPRISRDHTFVFPEKRGFSGKCLPKDVSAILAAARERNCHAELLEAAMALNRRFLAANAGEPAARKPAAPAEHAPIRRISTSTVPVGKAGEYRAH